MNHNDQKHNVPINYIVPNVVQSCFEEVRKKFEPFVQGTLELAEVQVLAGLTLRVMRLAKATRVLTEAGLFEESQLPFRSAAECTVNLLYIFKAGPIVGDKNSDSLAKQFLAYGDVAHEKMLKARPSQARRAFKRARGMNDAEYDVYYAEKVKLKNDAQKIHGCVSSRWHKENLQDRAKIVRENCPKYVDGHFADLLFSSFQGPNSATHADALSLRKQYKELGNKPLEMKESSDSMYVDATAMMALWTWKVLAEFYGQLDWLEEILNNSMRAELGSKLEKEIEKSNRTIILPWDSL